MTIDIGNYSLSVAILVAAATLLVSLAAVRFGSQGLSRAARGGIYALAGLLTLASVALMTAMVTSDFRLEYVVRYTERALPLGYKLAAFWAGQQGSLLLWAWLLAVMSALYALHVRRNKGPEHLAAIGVLALVIGFFAALMLFANTDEVKANPFETVAVVPEDGHGLNPMLQDPGMIAHPPVLFVGYAGFTIPFALVIGALVTGRMDKGWTDKARPWALVSWGFLGAGIVLGAQWAYVELGWGGYWAWDPVENASLLPWLTGTALLHSLIVQRHRGSFRRWTTTMAATTFLLCIFGTYLTRSGVISSVHAFPKSLIGDFFLWFLIVGVLATVLVMVWQRKQLRSPQPPADPLSREGVFTAANTLLVLMMAVTTVGTIWPILSKALYKVAWLLPAALRTKLSDSSAVTQQFYNRAVVPLALALVALMLLGPVVRYGATAAGKVLRDLGVPLAAGVATGIVLALLGIHSPWALAAGVICAAVLAGIAIDAIAVLRGQRHSPEQPFLPAVAQRFDASRRRYGAHMAHAGLVLAVIGIAGSSLYTTKQFVQLQPGQSAKVGRYELKLEELKEADGVNYQAIEARVIVTDASGVMRLLVPQRRLYNKAEQANSEVAIRWSFREDLYLTLGGWDDETRLTTLQVLINPLVVWIWVGGIVMAAGAVIGLLPRMSRATVAEDEEIPTAKTYRKAVA